MIKVAFNKPSPSTAFDDWVERCKKAVEKMTGASDVRTNLYKEQRKALLNLFHGKCAYCEAKIVLDQHNGDVEHFRPKGAITDEHDKGVEIDDGDGKRRPHPGYYWLAYDPLNLLPSCIACNRPGKLGDRRVGKWNRFPVSGKHATAPDEVVRERPLLLNPLLAGDDPNRHFDFDPDTGRIIGKTKRGQMTEAVLDLNREGLPEARRDVYDSVRARAAEAFVAELDQDFAKLEKHLDFLKRHKVGEAEYAMAGRPALARYEAALRKQAQRLVGSEATAKKRTRRTTDR